MKPTDVVKYYSNKNIREEMVSICKNREVIAKHMDGLFGKRPNIILFQREIYELAKKGFSSFHSSMERWSNPLELRQDMSLKELHDLRIGFDLILDIDCKLLEYSTICAKLLVEALNFHGIKNLGIKFSGNTGWHISVPFEAFPSLINNKEIKLLFPEVPQVIASYLREFISENLSEDILEYENNNIKNIIKKTGKEVKELTLKGRFNPYSILEIDTIALNSRHLFRLPYSLNEKSWLASIPVLPKELEDFDIKNAKPENVEPRYEFIRKPNDIEAKQLVIQAYDWSSRTIKEERKEKSMKFRGIEIKNCKLFPPCIKKILGGLEDGKKRSLFILISFLKNMGWGWQETDNQIILWNKKNKPPLKDSYVETQLKWFKKIKMSGYKTPNCSNEGYYKDINICIPDAVCKKVKNPLSYPIRMKKR